MANKNKFEIRDKDFTPISPKNLIKISENKKIIPDKITLIKTERIVKTKPYES
ncbi:hypothetical protein OMAG_000853, partial [Candidatus Omnitrophus magneticus]